MLRQTLPKAHNTNLSISPFSKNRKSSFYLALLSVLAVSQAFLLHKSERPFGNPKQPFASYKKL